MKKNTSTYSAILKSTTLELQWPYISDPDTRTSLMNEIKATQGRKYNPDTKVWSVSIYEAPALIDRLKKRLSHIPEAIKLADAINAIP